MSLWVSTAWFLTVDWIKTPRAAASFCPPTWARIADKSLLCTCDNKETHPNQLNFSKIYTQTSGSIFFFTQCEGKYEHFHKPAQKLQVSGWPISPFRKNAAQWNQVWLQRNIVQAQPEPIKDRLMLHHHRQLCTGEVPTMWQIWSTSVEKSGQISPSQDVSCW